MNGRHSEKTQKETEMCMKTQYLHDMVDNFAGKVVLVVGDFCLDAYLTHNPNLGDPVSAENGQPPFSVFKRRYSPGGAGNVTVNVTALGGQCLAFGVIGSKNPTEDAEGIILTECLKSAGVKDFLLTSPRNTPTYSKPIHHETGVESPRVDLVNVSQVYDETVVDLLFERLAQIRYEYRHAGCSVIVNDQIKMGLSSPYFIEKLKSIRADWKNTPFIVDSRRHAAQYMSPGMIMKLNSYEAVNLLEKSEFQDPLQVIPDVEVVRVLPAIYERTGCPVYITRGNEGVIVYNGKSPIRVPTDNLVGKVDPCGAGDTAVAIMALCYAADKEARSVDVAWLANAGASITCEQINTTGVATPEKLKKRVELMASMDITALCYYIPPHRQLVR